MGRVVASCMVGVLAALLASAPVRSAELGQQISTAADNAARLAGGGRYIEALEALGEASEAVWEAAPLSFRKALFVAAQPGGFGVYELRDSAAYKAGEQVLIYVEPVGYGYKQDGSLYVVDLAADVTLKDGSGGVLGGQKDFARFGIRSRVRNREFYAFITYNFSGLNPGSYVAETTLTDAVTGKSGSFDLAFTIVE